MIPKWLYKLMVKERARTTGVPKPLTPIIWPKGTIRVWDEREVYASDGRYDRLGKEQPL